MPSVDNRTSVDCTVYIYLPEVLPYLTEGCRLIAELFLESPEQHAILLTNTHTRTHTIKCYIKCIFTKLRNLMFQQ